MHWMDLNGCYSRGYFKLRKEDHLREQQSSPASIHLHDTCVRHSQYKQR